MLDEPLDRVTQRPLERRKFELAPKKRQQLLVGCRFAELPIGARAVELAMLPQRTGSVRDEQDVPDTPPQSQQQQQQRRQLA